MSDTTEACMRTKLRMIKAVATNANDRDIWQSIRLIEILAAEALGDNPAKSAELLTQE